MQEDPNNALQGSLDALRASFLSVLLFSVVVSLVAYGITKKIPRTYEVHFSYMISMDQKDAPVGFRYDGYYALSAADLFSTTLASVASSPETIVAAYRKAAITLPTQDALKLVRTVVSEKAAPQLVRLTVRDASQKNAEALASGLIVVMNGVIDEYNTKGLSSVVFHGVPNNPWTSVSTVAPLPVAVSFFMVVFLGGNMLVLFREALRRGSL